MKMLIALLGLLSAGLLSIALADAIGSVPIAWAIGFITNGLFRLLDGPAARWIRKA